jgi:hypothetical protein
MRRKGELSPSALDRGWPYQVALAQLDGTEQYRRYTEIHEFVRDLSHAPRGHSFHRNGTWFDVHCFALRAHALAFKERFGGEDYDPVRKRRR